jgi:hypothetical protein
VTDLPLSAAPLVAKMAEAMYEDWFQPVAIKWELQAEEMREKHLSEARAALSALLSAEQECETCGGAGTILEADDPFHEGAADGAGLATHDTDCPTCNGSGSRGSALMPVLVEMGFDYDVNERPEWVACIDRAIAAEFECQHPGGDTWWFDPRPFTDRVFRIGSRTPQEGA